MCLISFKDINGIKENIIIILNIREDGHRALQKVNIEFIREINSREDSFLLSLLSLGASVESEGTVMISTLLDKILLMEVSENFSSYGSVDFEFIADNGNSETQEFGCLLCDSLVSLGIKEDSIVKLFLYLYFGPTLLLGLST